MNDYTRFSISILAALLMLTLGLSDAFVPEAQARPDKGRKANKHNKLKNSKPSHSKTNKAAKGHKADKHPARGHEARPQKPSKHKEGADKERGDKATVCHVPPGNPTRGRAINVGAPALRAHMGHGDCQSNAPPGARCSCGDEPPHEDVPEEGEEIEGDEAKELFQERRKHLNRMARLARFETIAGKGGDEAFRTRVVKLRRTEQVRHKKALAQIEGLKPSR